MSSKKDDDASIMEHKNTAKFGMRKQIFSSSAEHQHELTGQMNGTRNGAEVMDICFESFNPLSTDQPKERKIDGVAQQNAVHSCQKSASINNQEISVNSQSAEEVSVPSRMAYIAAQTNRQKDQVGQFHEESFSASNPNSNKIGSGELSKKNELLLKKTSINGKTSDPVRQFFGQTVTNGVKEQKSHPNFFQSLIKEPSASHASESIALKVPQIVRENLQKHQAKFQPKKGKLTVNQTFRSQISITEATETKKKTRNHNTARQSHSEVREAIRKAKLMTNSESQQQVNLLQMSDNRLGVHQLKLGATIKPQINDKLQLNFDHLSRTSSRERVSSTKSRRSRLLHAHARNGNQQVSPLVIRSEDGDAQVASPLNIVSMKEQPKNAALRQSIVPNSAMALRSTIPSALVSLRQSMSNNSSRSKYAAQHQRRLPFMSTIDQTASRVPLLAPSSSSIFDKDTAAGATSLQTLLPPSGFKQKQNSLSSQRFTRNTLLVASGKHSNSMQLNGLSQQGLRFRKAQVKVIARFRPYSEAEQYLSMGSQQQAAIEFSQQEDNVIHILERNVINSSKPVDELSNTSRSRNNTSIKNTFKFDYVFQPSASQQEVYELAAGTQLVKDALEGYNSSVIAYGQTGSGKTYTMFGKEGSAMIRSQYHHGIIPRVAHDIFQQIELDQQKNGSRYSVSLQMVEIYNEQLIDLLVVPIQSNTEDYDANMNRKELRIKESPTLGTYVAGLTCASNLSSESQLMDILSLGERNRHVTSTQQNNYSSRSHSICIIKVSEVRKDNDELIRRGIINLVDLAGSERVSKSYAKGQALEEAKKINASLSTLGKVIHSLVKSTRNSHIPYRDSKLTRLLKESLGGNSKTTLIVNCSMHFCQLEETLSTIRFAQSAKMIQTRVRMNLSRSESLHVQAMQRGHQNSILSEQNQQLAAALTELKNELDTTRAELELQTHKNMQISMTEGNLPSKDELFELKQQLWLEREKNAKLMQENQQASRNFVSQQMKANQNQSLKKIAESLELIYRQMTKADSGSKKVAVGSSRAARQNKQLMQHIQQLDSVTFAESGSRHAVNEPLPLSSQFSTKQMRPQQLRLSNPLQYVNRQQVDEPLVKEYDGYDCKRRALSNRKRAPDNFQVNKSLESSRASWRAAVFSRTVSHASSRVKHHGRSLIMQNYKTDEEKLQLKSPRELLQYFNYETKNLRMRSQQKMQNRLATTSGTPQYLGTLASVCSQARRDGTTIDIEDLHKQGESSGTDELCMDEFEDRLQVVNQPQTPVNGEVAPANGSSVFIFPKSPSVARNLCARCLKQIQPSPKGWSVKGHEGSIKFQSSAKPNRRSTYEDAQATGSLFKQASMHLRRRITDEPVNQNELLDKLRKTLTRLNNLIDPPLTYDRDVQVDLMSQHDRSGQLKERKRLMTMQHSPSLANQPYKLQSFASVSRSGRRSELRVSELKHGAQTGGRVSPASASLLDSHQRVNNAAFFMKQRREALQQQSSTSRFATQSKYESQRTRRQEFPIRMTDFNYFTKELENMEADHDNSDSSSQRIEDLDEGGVNPPRGRFNEWMASDNHQKGESRDLLVTQKRKRISHGLKTPIGSNDGRSGGRLPQGRSLQETIPVQGVKRCQRLVRMRQEENNR